MAPPRHIPRELDGVPVVLEHAERPCCHYIDAKDIIWQSGPRRNRDSTITAIGKKGRALYVLGSGHGMLPVDDQRKVLRQFDYRTHDAAVTIALDDEGGRRFTARLLHGEIGGALDYGLARVSGSVAPADYDSWHLATNSYPPHPSASGMPTAGTELWHVSRLRGRPNRVKGLVARRRSIGSLSLRMLDGTSASYTGVLAVSDSHQDVPFSLDGESGGLVVDADQQVVGTVVGGKTAESYVLPIKPLITKLQSLNLQFLFQGA